MATLISPSECTWTRPRTREIPPSRTLRGKMGGKDLWLSGAGMSAEWVGTDVKHVYVLQVKFILCVSFNCGLM